MERSKAYDYRSEGNLRGNWKLASVNHEKISGNVLWVASFLLVQIVVQTASGRMDFGVATALWFSGFCAETAATDSATLYYKLLKAANLI
jgi:hypothetical protein